MKWKPITELPKEDCEVDLYTVSYTGMVAVISGVFDKHKQSFQIEGLRTEEGENYDFNSSNQFGKHFWGGITQYCIKPITPPLNKEKK